VEFVPSRGSKSILPDRLLDGETMDLVKGERNFDVPDVKALSPVLWLIIGSSLDGIVDASLPVNVTQFHNHESRDGLYIDSAFTPSAAANLTRDLNFDGTIVGNVYAQPLYIENGPGGKAMIIVVTESNNVYALDAADGTLIWQRNVGEPVSADDLVCTKLDPLGITGTPVVDVPSRALFLAAMITPDGGVTKKHLIFSLNVDTGDVNPGWPVDVQATASYEGVGFTPEIQMQRPALGLVGGILYVGYGSMRDCSPFHGWLVGVPIETPDKVTAWAAATKTHGGAIWGVGGIASDGETPFVVTGNTFNPASWQGGQAVIRFQPGPIFSGSPVDYWVPENWLTLDAFDEDLGSSGPLLVDVPGVIPSHLVVALGKDRNMYLLNRDNLGGISAPVAASVVASSTILQAAVTYQTKQNTYVALRANNDGDTVLSAVRITATNPPTIASGWNVTRAAGGCGSPFVTSTDGTNNMIVWVVGTEDHLTAGDQRLHGYDGDTGAVVYEGGGPNELMAGTHYYSTTGIVARGRIYVAGDNKVYAFGVTSSTPTPTPTSTPTPTATLAPRLSPTPRARPTPAPRPLSGP
jgi:outer membrane protein assembly factor BamB